MGIFSGNYNRKDSGSSKSQPEQQTPQEQSIEVDDYSKFSDLPSSVRGLRADDVSSINFGESATEYAYKSASPTSMSELDMMCIVEGGNETSVISAIEYSACDSPDRTIRIEPEVVTPTGENRSLLSMPSSKNSAESAVCSQSLHTASSKETLPRSNKHKPHLLISNMVYLSLMIDPKITKGKTRASQIVQDTLREQINKVYPVDSIVNRRKSQPVDVDDISFVGESLSEIVEVAEYHIAKRNFSAAVEIYKTLLKGQTKEAVGGQHDVAITVRELATLYMYKGDARRAYKCIAEVLALQTEERRPEGVAIALAEKGLILFSNNNTDDAMRAWQESLQVVCKLFGYGHTHVPLLLNNMACYHYSKGEFDDSLSKFEESLQLQRNSMQTCGTDVFDADTSLLNIALTLCNMGAVVAKQNQYQTAMELIEEALLVQESVQDGELVAVKTKEYLDSLMSYGEKWVDDMANKNDQHNCDGRRLRGQRTLFGDNDGVPMHAVSRNTIDLSDFIQLGPLECELSPTERVKAAVQSSFDACRAKNSDDETFPFHRYCHPEPKKMSIPISVDDHNVIDAELHLKNIFLQATEHLKLDQIKEALDLFESSLQSIVDKYGEIHHLVGTMLHNLGIVHLHDESYVLALKYFQKAVNVRSTALGPNHPDVAASILKTAMVQIARQDLDCANVIFLQLLHTQRRDLGYNHLQISLFLNNIGCMHYEFGGLFAALKSFEEALEIQRTHSDNTQDESTLLALTYTLCNIGFVYVRRKDFASAIYTFEEALDIQRKILDPDHPSLESIMHNLDYIKECTECKSLSRPVGCHVSDILSNFRERSCNSTNL